MSHKPPVKKKISDLVILAVLVGAAGFLVFTRVFSGDRSSPHDEDELLLMGLDPRATPIPGRSVMGDENHDRLTGAVSGRKDQLSDLELMGLRPGTEADVKTPPSDPAPEPPDPAPDPVEPHTPEVLPDLPDDPDTPPEGTKSIERPYEPVSDPAEPAVIPEDDPEPESEPGTTEGIWVRSSREGANPIRVEDHVSVDAKQLSEMAGFRNISTDPSFAPPQFNISGVGSGRLGTYVIVDHQMIRLNGQINSPASPPRAWRLVEATANEVFWEPIP